jgi:WD40 repeat protein
MRLARPHPVLPLLVVPTFVASSLTAGEVTFYQHVAPIFKKSCVSCHSGEKPRAQLSLESLETLLAGGKKGPPVAAGKPQESLLYLLASRSQKPAMPPKAEEALGEAEVETIRAWIAGGSKPGTPPVEVAPYSRPLSPPSYRRPPVLTALAYSPDGKQLYAGAHTEIVIVEAEPADAAASSGPLARLLGEAERILSLQVSPDGRKLLAAGGTPALFGELQVWDLEQRALERHVRLGRDTLFCAAWSPDGSRIAAGGTDRAIHVLEAATGKELHAAELHSDWIFALGFGEGGTRIFSAGRDKTLKVCEAENGKLVTTLATLNDPIFALAVRPGGAPVLCASEGRTPILFDAKELKEVRKLEGQPGIVLCQAFSADGKLLAVGGAGEEARVYQTEDGARKKTLRGHREWVYALAFRPDGERLATAGYEGIVRIYGLADEKELRSFVPVPVAAGR